MNFKKANLIFNYSMLGLLGVMMGILLVLTIIGGVQSGDLTFSGLPIWLWNHTGIVYFFLGCITVGGMIDPISKDYDKTVEGKKEEEIGNASLALLVLLVVCGIFWPVVWSWVVFDWFRKKFKGEEE